MNNKSNTIQFIVLLSILILGCNSDDLSQIEPQNQLVGNYVSLGGAIGLASGDSLIVSNDQIKWKDGGYCSDSEGNNVCPEDWTTVNYTIASDSTILLNEPLLWGGSDHFEYYYRIESDTSIYLDSRHWNYWVYVCCKYSWIK